MAAKMDLSDATTLEGQLVMIIEELVNHQDDTIADTGKNRDNIQLITANNYNDLTGTMNLTMVVSATSKPVKNGFMLEADEVFYPKVIDPNTV